MKDDSPITAWKLAYWALFTAWVGGVAMTMCHVRGGLLTSYLADVAFPPWYYIVARGLATGGKNIPIMLRWIGHSPERTATAIFLVGIGYELSQLYWPHGLFAGTYDPLDIVAYGVGLLVCYGCEKKKQRCLSRSDRMN